MKNMAADSLSTLSDSALLDKLNQVVIYGRRVVLRLLDFLNEVESRRLHVRNAYPSMFAFCRKELRFSEGEASRKLAAARLIKRFPIIRRALELGEVHMTALALAQSEFTPENVITLLEQLKGKTSREVERFLMETNPAQARPAPSPAHQLRKLPAITSTPSRAAAAASAPLLERATVRPSEPPASPLLAQAVSKTTSREPGLPTPAVPSEHVASPPDVASSATASEQAGVPSARLQAATPASPVRATKIPFTLETPPPAPKATPPIARYAVGFEASAALHDKLQRLRALMAHENPSGDLAPIVERAVDLLIAKIEKERFGQTERPRNPAGGDSRPARAPKDPSRISNATKRIVLARDGWRCSFVGENGERCTEHRFLQFDHRVPRALGGTGDPTNMRITCRAHNLYEAERVFGVEHVRSHIRRHQRRHSPNTHDDGSGVSTPQDTTRPRVR